MTAFIEIRTKSHKGGQTFINDQINGMNDAYKWFDMNMDFIRKQAKRRSIECVMLYVMEQYNTIYSDTIQ